MVPMVPGWEYKEHDTVGKEGAVPDEINPWERLSSLKEHGHTGPTA